MRTSLDRPTAHGVRLSPESLAELRRLLVEESATQAARCGEHLALVAQLRGLTDGDSVLERELAEAGAARAEETAADVAHALERMENGTYGWCEACGAPMPFERLQAIPSARLCVACPRNGVRNRQ
jgi:RNA polymerase-binding transcription factor DksA